MYRGGGGRTDGRTDGRTRASERERGREKERENRKEKERKNKEVCTFLPDMYFRALNDSEALASVHIALNYVRIHSDTFV